MTEVTAKTRQPRTPRNADSVTKGALALPLEDRVTLRDALNDSIVKEVELLQAHAERAAKIANSK